MGRKDAKVKTVPSQDFSSCRKEVSAQFWSMAWRDHELEIRSKQLINHFPLKSLPTLSYDHARPKLA